MAATAEKRGKERKERGESCFLNQPQGGLVSLMVYRKKKRREGRSERRETEKTSERGKNLSENKKLICYYECEY